jgi:undecaprenyl pyrophosphate phosphatase UppP
MAFRVGFIVTFLVSIIAISVYAVYLAFHVFRPFGSIIAILSLSVLLAWKYRTDSQAGFRKKYWWAPLVVISAALAFLSYNHYTLNQLGSLAFTISLLLITVGFLIYCSLRKQTRQQVTD